MAKLQYKYSKGEIKPTFEEMVETLVEIEGDEFKKALRQSKEKMEAPSFIDFWSFTFFEFVFNGFIYRCEISIKED